MNENTLINTNLTKTDLFRTEDVERKLDMLEVSKPLPYVALRTGLCYDARMRFHSTNNPLDLHPEDPRRVYMIYRALISAGLVNGSDNDQKSLERNQLALIDAVEATAEDISLVHSLEHANFIAKTALMSVEELDALELISNSVYFNRESAFCGRLSCGGTIEACAAVVERKVKNAIAVVRPPGHHAEPQQAMGFCLFNNVAVATRVMLQRYSHVKKVLILDWDVHHGNGTQRAFWHDPNVLYMSIHRYEEGRFYPASSYGNLDKVGEGEGTGRTVNVPWPTGGMGDGDYLYAFQKYYKLCGDLILVSAGFDAAAGDEIGECFVTPAAYGHMTHLLKGLAGGNLVVVLEGGYNLDSISKSAVAVTKVLMGETPTKMQSAFASPAATLVVSKVIEEQSKFWRNVTPTHYMPPIGETTTTLHDLIRVYQSKQLFERLGMTILPIARESISPSYQVLCTSSFHSKSTLIFFVHDAPEVWGCSISSTNQISPQNTVMLDPLNMYLDWAVEQHYGVIDVNVPSLLTGLEEESLGAIQSMQELCVYIWDNYVELSEAANVIFMGVGNACAGLTYLLCHRGELTECNMLILDTRHKLKACVNFIGSSKLRPVNNVMGAYFPEWYYNNSMVYTGISNPVWSSGRKPKRKFGKVFQMKSNYMENIMSQAYGNVLEFVEQRCKL